MGRSSSDQVSAEGCGPYETDSDGDGSSDVDHAFPNVPNKRDSHGDGHGDNEESAAGSDPNDPDDQPTAPGLPVWLLLEAF